MNKNSRIINFVKGMDVLSNRLSCKGSIEIIGDKRVIVEKTNSILEYTESSVRLDLSKITVVICGAGLTLYDYSEKNIVIDGKIKSISFE